VRQQVEQAQRAVNNPTFTGTGGGYRFAVVEGDGGTGSAYDAGPGAAEQPAIGMSAEEFEKKFGRCFESRSDTAVAGQLGGRMWGMRDLIVCRELYPGLTESSVVIFEGKIVNILPNSQISTEKYKVTADGKLVPMTEAEKAKAAAQGTAKPATPSPAPTPPPGQPPIQTTGPGASVPQPVAPPADPSRNQPTTEHIWKP
jgi:hypothetical protein